MAGCNAGGLGFYMLIRENPLSRPAGGRKSAGVAFVWPIETGYHYQCWLNMQLSMCRDNKSHGFRYLLWCKTAHYGWTWHQIIAGHFAMFPAHYFWTSYCSLILSLKIVHTIIGAQEDIPDFRCVLYSLGRNCQISFFHPQVPGECNCAPDSCNSSRQFL